jgi:hypothetical protein
MPQIPVDPQRMMRLTAEAGALGYADLAEQLGRALALNEAQAQRIDAMGREAGAQAAELGQLRQANELLQARLAGLEQTSGDGEEDGSP